MPSVNTAFCPLCRNADTAPYHRDNVRDYIRCRTCALVFVPESQHLGPKEQKAYYDLHQNFPEDEGYRRFLKRLFHPLNARLKPNAHGLDFGCGPGPALSSLFEETGRQVAIFDPLYAPNPDVFNQPYDFIALSEVAEHLAQPGEDLDRLWTLIKPGGWLGIMTQRVIDKDAFARWRYILDPTHISFFSDATFHWLAEHWGKKEQEPTLVFEGKDVVLMGKP